MFMLYTKKQKEILAFISQFQKEEGFSPTLEEIARHFQISRVTAFGHIRALEKKGGVKKRPHESRSIQILDPEFVPAGYTLPLLGMIQAGMPIEAIETPEVFDLSAMIPLDEPVHDYLEGVGTGKEHPGTKVPFIAVPTTAGTGSEATKNAVLSRPGRGGFKKSMRHDSFIPDVALVDPVLTLTCPPEVSAACGLDAFTQLLESFVSTRAGPVTDALALSGMERACRGLVPSVLEGASNLEARAHMAYASLLSGITLANAGLGTVHGFASEIGGLFDAPHGVICGTLLAPVTRLTIVRLRENRTEENLRRLEKYAAAGALLGGAEAKGIDDACNRLVERIDEWTETLKIARLARLGVTEADLPVIAASTGNKNNPVDFDRDDLVRILRERL